LQEPHAKSIILRHDVDDKKLNSLRFARIQSEFGIKGSYYFRAVPQSWDDAVIKKIVDLGHEIGYHYESLTTCNGNMEAAYEDFKANLARLRKLVPVSTICMHGSPRSKWDSKDLWRKQDEGTKERRDEETLRRREDETKSQRDEENYGQGRHTAVPQSPNLSVNNSEDFDPYDYRSYGIIGEPYFDIDFNEMFYLTDTGRRWDGWKVSIRDKMPQQEMWAKRGLIFHSTKEIIKAAEEGRLPDRIMMTFHPQRWNDAFFPWMKELVWQNVKNQGKWFLLKLRR